MKQLSLFGAGVSSYSELVTAQRRLNCYYDMRPDGDPANVVVRGTPGSFIWVTLPAAPVRGFCVVSTMLYAVAGAGLYSVDVDGNITPRGTLSTSTGYVRMAADGVRLLLVDGVGGYTLPLSGPGVVSPIADSNFPAGATHAAFLDSKLIVNVPGSREFRVSQTLDATAWTPLIFATKESNSDLLVALTTTSDYMVLFGQQTLEFWGDQGTSPNPFGRINGATQPWGCAAVNSIASLGKSLIFLGQNKEGGVQVLHLVGYTPQRVSNSDIEYIFSNFAVYTDAIAYTYMTDGHPMYQITFPTAGRSFLYDASTQMWFEVQTGLDAVARHYGNLGIAFNSKNYFADTTTGNLYQLDTSTYTDNGTPIKRVITSRHLQAGGDEFGVAEIELRMEHGTQLVTDPTPQMVMQISRDGGKTFGPERWRDLGAAGRYYTPRVRWERCGNAYDMVLRFTLTAPIKFVVTEAFASIRQ